MPCGKQLPGTRQEAYGRRRSRYRGTRRKEVSIIPRAQYDTIVVGAGPAGVMAAREAGKQGTVLLIDSSSLPRDKSCGGMLNEYAQQFLAEETPVPASVVLEPEHVHFRYWDWDRGIQKPTKLRFLNVDRAGFDAWLMGLLPDSVDVAPNTAVTDVQDTDSEVIAHLRNGSTSSVVTCGVLVGADGARSAVRRSIGAQDASKYVTLQDRVALHGELEPYFDCIYMGDIGDSFAYAYVVPKGESALVGSVFYPRTKRPQDKHDAVLEMLRARLGALGDSDKREASVALSVRAPSDVMPGRGRVLLTGEAGGFMSPTSGEGISYAMNSGRLAGRAIADGGPSGALDAYTVWTDPIVRNIRRKLRWLPFMESRAGKYIAGYVPTPLVSSVTKGL